MFRSNAQIAPSVNVYCLAGEPLFTLGDRHDVTLAALQATGIELGSSVSRPPAQVLEKSPLHLEASMNLAFDADGLLEPDARAQLVVLRSLAGQYGPGLLTVLVHLQNGEDRRQANALSDLEDVYPSALHYDRKATTNVPVDAIRLFSSQGRLLEEWRGFQNAATLGGAVRARLGAPPFAHLQRPETSEEKQ
jgi:hypothetical protein